MRGRAWSGQVWRRLAFSLDRRSPSDSVLITSPLVSQPFLAMPVPKRRKPKCSRRWASQLTTHFTPLSRARRQSRQNNYFILIHTFILTYVFFDAI
jgi:hypothetical protein